MNVKRILKNNADPEQDKYGVLSLGRFDIAADALIQVLEEAGASMYESAEPFGECRYLHVRGITEDRLRELYENFTKAVEAVNKEAGDGEEIQN